MAWHTRPALSEMRTTPQKMLPRRHDAGVTEAAHTRHRLALHASVLSRGMGSSNKHSPPLSTRLAPKNARGSNLFLIIACCRSPQVSSIMPLVGLCKKRSKHLLRQVSRSTCVDCLKPPLELVCIPGRRPRETADCMHESGASSDKP